MVTIYNLDKKIYYNIALCLDYEDEYRINQLCKTINNPYGWKLNINGFILN